MSPFRGAKLNDGNWTQFEFAFTAHLRQMGLYEAILREVSDELEAACFSALIQALSEDQYSHIYDCKTTREAWSVLKGKHRAEDARAAFRHSLEYLTKKLGGDESMEKHLEALMESARRLDAATGTRVTDMDFMTTACLSVQHDPRYAATVEVLMQNVAAVSKKKVVDILVDAEKRQKMVSDMDGREPQTALYATSRQGRPKDGAFKKKRKGKCHTCGKTGHWARECKNKIASQESVSAAATEEFLFSTTGKGDRTGGLSWLLDSGASSHMVMDVDILEEAERLETPTVVTLGDGHRMKATHRGMVRFPNGSRLREVLFVPGLNENLFSIGKACRTDGVKVVFANDRCKVWANGKLVFDVTRRDGVFRALINLVKGDQRRSSVAEGAPSSQAMAATSGGSNPDELHRRFGHINLKTLKLMSSTGIILTMNGSPNDCRTCDVCLKGKMTRALIPKQSTSHP
jgi:hypothetical protein